MNDVWWERAGHGRTGPAGPPVPVARRLVPAVAGLVGLVVFAGTVAAVEGSRSSGTGAAHERPAGLAALTAGCGPSAEWTVSGRDVGLVQPGAGPNGTQVAYRTVPPSYGRFLPLPAPPSPAAYLPGQAFPVVERLVHNMRRGYTVVFYDRAVPRPDVEQAAAWARGRAKVLVVPYDSTRPRFPGGAHVGVATWGVTQTCARLDPAALAEFVRAYPPSRAPDPNEP